MSNDCNDQKQNGKITCITIYIYIYIYIYTHLRNECVFLPENDVTIINSGEFLAIPQ